jgi:TPP-dependent pyruvate/acetoin dehydrogenase alpha subunit
METSSISERAPRASHDEELVSILDSERARSGLDDETLSRLFVAMARTRLCDARLEALAAEGKTHVHLPAGGQEAAVVGAASALGEHDWVFPTVRDLGVFLYRGVTLDQIFANAFGSASDPAKGRQMPSHRTARSHRIASAGSLKGTHLTHAAGFAWAARIAGDPVAVLAFADREAIPSADFHTALNFAGVFDAPVVFVFKNPRRDQRTTAVAPKGIAYGVPGVRVDGDDVLAVHSVVAEALRKAHDAGGPTLVELVTGATDPLSRFGGWLAQQKLMDAAAQTVVGEDIELELTEAVDRASRIGAPAAATLFDDVYESIPPHLSEQRAEHERRQR